ncbi:MAG: hypothetical protein IAE93_01720 [Ignavibacteria bacterium]|nr:hypothetical protein [Ignavibacteria bacterium]
MKNTKLIKLLETFSIQEMKKFRDFVKSPFYNKNKNVIKLNEVLQKYYPVFESKKFTDENIYSAVFGKGEFDYFKLRNITSDLYNLTEEFLKLQPNPATEFIAEYNLIVQLRLRKLFGLHKKIVLNLKEEFKNNEFKGSEFLYDNYLLTRESQIVDLFEKPSSITGILEEFESYYEYLIFHLLQYYNLLIHISKDNNVKIDIKMIDEVLSYLEKGPVSTHPTTLSYQYLLLLKLRGGDNNYFTLKNHYFSNFDKMDAADAYRAHMHMFGYCADMYNLKGDRRFINEGYELYKHSYLNQRVTSGELLYPDFVNFIKVFARAGDAELAGKFINDYSSKLPEDQLENCMNFANAYIAHSIGDLKTALTCISKVNFPLAILKVQVKIMQVQVCFQLGYFEETRSLVDSFRKSLVKEEIISELFKNSILDFLRSTISLINLKEETDVQKKQYEFEKLKDTILNSQLNPFGIKFWLEDRMYEFK